MSKDCIFCKIANGEIEDFVFWENENAVAVLDINPFIKGHVLVIPKEHSRWVWDIDDKKYYDLMMSVKKVAELLKNAFNVDCVQEFIVGMEVPHVHIHLLPRREGDGFDEIPSKRLDPKPSEEEMKEILDKIKSKL